MKWISVLLIVIVLASLAGGAVWYVRRDTGGEATYRTAQVTRGGLLATITATGTLEPEEAIDVGAQVQGRIIKFGTDKDGKQVDNNSEVDEGTILAWIDPSVYKSEEDQAKAQLAQAIAGVARAQADLGAFQAKYTQSQRDWERAKRLGPSDALAQADYDAAESAYESAKANLAVGQAEIAQANATVQEDQASVDRASQNLKYCTIPSPVKGVIITRRVNIGQTVVSSLSAPSLFLIAKDLTRMQIWTAVNEADIGNIHDGQDVTFTVDAYGNRKFTGKVSKVRLDAQMTQNVVTYTVEITTDNKDRALIPYMTANVSFQVAKKENALLVPNVALRWSPSDPDTIAPDAKAEAESGGGHGQREEAGGAPVAGAVPTSRPSQGQAEGQAQAQGEHQGRGHRGGGESSGGGSGSAGVDHARGTVWVQDGQFVRPIKLRLGVTDSVNTEVISGDLKEGQAVITGDPVVATADSGDAKNPFAPNFRGGRRGGSSGGGKH
jgi:HlyD family secretion protein